MPNTDLGFPGSYRTVCYFISEWENTHQEEKDNGYERLEHPPCEAQVDFGVMEAVQDGEIVDIHALVMSFPNSNSGFSVPLPSENQECFLHGLSILFKQAGGVPKRIRIDNLTPAVYSALSSPPIRSIKSGCSQFKAMSPRFKARE
ncbi:hypothetical protein [Globicatella sanguinis]|uniref:hypothetical protein n=1 Tax=Globicatella sanguinis TaxID=13076 RepID=UPI0025433983|nr:hypothetical protein [Globicatella sanguinis]WIK66145.1 hypothetical protein CYJ72_009535 [Globicatella sanguinis]WKT55550.1 hypothetical protein Q3C38_09535 [Globicatella sanguinis]